MIKVTTEAIPGKKVVKVLGLVRGNTIRCRHIGHDVMAAFRNIVGGEIADYTKAIAEAREQALDRMETEAAELGADAIVMVRFSTSEVVKHAAEILAYGTAVITEDLPEEG
jgi:uncharacterized protein YbjQ (UPF0145 family)